jgi:hypothetical protein
MVPQGRAGQSGSQALPMNPRYPLYIVSKSRADSRLTSKALETMTVPYHIIIEEEQYDDYAAVIDPQKILLLPKRYQDEYDTFDTLGNTKSKGPGAARNFAWDHAIEQGFERHWVMDDNIRCFFRYNRNSQIIIESGVFFRAMEDFVDRYKNIAMAGPQYYMFCPRKAKQPPFVLNTRIYSCNLILNSAPYRWRGRYNEDTDLSLRMLKDGWCTVQFNAFLQQKITTQYIQGGNTEAFYSKEGTIPKSSMLVKMHPDVARMVWKFRRWHHHVNYAPFKNNQLIRKENIEIPKGVNEYGLQLIEKTKKITNQ